MVLNAMKQYDNSILQSNQERWRISHLSKHLSYGKRSHLPASAEKLKFCGFFPFLQNRGYIPGAEKSLARPTSRCILFDGENISFDSSLVICINSNNITPIMIINRIYEHQILLSL